MLRSLWFKSAFTGQRPLRWATRTCNQLAQGTVAGDVKHQQAQVVDTEPDWDVALCNGWPTPGRGSAVSMGSEALDLLAQVAAVAAAEIGVWLDRLLGQLTTGPD